MDACNTALAHGQRRAPRFSGELRGSVRCYASSYPCLVEDISEHGLLFISTAPLRIGDRVTIVLQISAENHLTSVVEVRHVTDEGIGAQIVDISQADARQLSQLIAPHYAMQRKSVR